MKLTEEMADEFGKQIGKSVKAAIKNATDQMEARLLGLEARMNALEAAADEGKGMKGKRK